MRLAGKASEVTPVLEKALSPMVSRTEPSAKVMVLRAEQYPKAYAPMVLKLAGKASEVTPVLKKA